MSQMRSYVYAVDPSTDMAKCKDEERFWLPRVMIGDVRYSNFVGLVSIVMGLGESKHAKRALKLERVLDSRVGGPYVDAIPDDFRDKLAMMPELGCTNLAKNWHAICDWGHYGHWIAPWENLVELIVQQIRAIAVFAKSYGFVLYYSQDIRHSW